MTGPRSLTESWEDFRTNVVAKAGGIPPADRAKFIFFAGARFVTATHKNLLELSEIEQARSLFALDEEIETTIAKLLAD